MIPNDSALTTRVSFIDKNKQMVPYTECTAIDNGWVWQIPLWDKIGTGYVYSSKYIEDDNAQKQFKSNLDKKVFDTRHSVFKKIPMTPIVNNIAPKVKKCPKETVILFLCLVELSF